MSHDVRTSDATQLSGRFQIEAELARGGMGAVFVAVDTSSGKRVALKRLTRGAPPRVAALFEREFYVLASLKHPRIIEVYEYGVDAHGPFYSMELLQGTDLRDLSPMPPMAACRYLRDVASSLALLHARRLLHRDVSPRNVRTLPEGGCKLIDFGALTTFGSAEELVGTPPAIPPEALAGLALDQRSDLYALGALAYFLLTGTHAYPARTVYALPDAWTSRAALPSQLVRDVPSELDQLVMALLNLDVLARPTSAAEVIDRLNGIAGLPPEHDEQVARAYFVGTSLVERGRELARVQRRLQRAKTGRGSAVYVDGAPGVGKSRFLDEVLLRAQLSGITALRVDAALHAGPLSTVRALVQQLMRLLPRLAGKVFGARAPRLEEAWVDLFSGLSFRADATSLTEVDPNDPVARASVSAVIERCVLDVAEKQPLLIAVDNVHEADRESAAVLLTLARAARREPILLLTTAPELRELSALGDLPGLRALRESGNAIRLRALSERGTLELVHAAFGAVPQARRTATRLFAATSGNPEHCMRLLQLWVASGLIRYAGGVWSLPFEIPEDALLAAELEARNRLLACSPLALELAATLALFAQPAMLESCIAMLAQHPSREVIGALEELVQADVLADGPRGFRFLHEPLRSSALEAIDGATQRALSLRLGEYLLAQGSGYDVQTAAGLQLIQSGAAERGAQLIAAAARTAIRANLVPQELAKGAPALEAALRVYRELGRTRLAQIELLVALSMASYAISPGFAARYADDTLEALERALGIWGLRALPELPDAATLGARLAAAPVLEPGDVRDEHTPDVLTLAHWLVSSTITLVAVASAAIDHEQEARYADVLRPFTVFGELDQVAAAYQFCQLMIRMAEDHFTRAHTSWSEMLALIPRLGFPPAVEMGLRRGALQSLGILESQRDDDVALERLQEIERDATPAAKVVADQLRFLYHGFRGDLESAEHYRDRVEAYAVEHGSAWQIEIWSTCTLSAVYGNTGDVAGNRRILEQLERLKESAPSLEPYWERCLAGQHYLTGSYARAVEVYHATLARPEARERVGWGATRGALARAYNALGQHTQALQVCEETLAERADDLDYVAMTLGLRLQLCRALIGLGDAAGARTRLDAMFERYAPNANPVTLGGLHGVYAELAQREGDVEAFERRVSAMHACYEPTRNPALIAQCERMRRTLDAGQSPRPQLGDPAAGGGETLAASVLATCRGSDERKLRALQLVAAQAGAGEAFLFTRGYADEPALASSLGASPPAEALVLRIRELFEEIPEDSDETAFMPESEATTAADITVLSSQHRLLALTVAEGGKRLLVGAIALLAPNAQRTISPAFLNDVAQQMFQAGDLARVRGMN